ncbi:MAG: transglycosylase domain-containing protein [Micavibrio sp.]
MTTDDSNTENNIQNDSVTKIADDQPKPMKHPAYRKWLYRTLLGSVLVIPPVAYEAWQSPLQSWYFNGVAEGRFATKTVTDPKIFPPAQGPFDIRRGYNKFPEYDRNLTKDGKWKLQSAAPWQDRNVFGLRLNLLNDEAPQAGVHILDNTGKSIYKARFPLNVYSSFDDIPPVLIKSLLFVENAELLENHPPEQNPAVEWDRFGKAAFLQAVEAIGIKGNYPGASTAAVQKEKYKYSPNGNTGHGFKGHQEKFRQMATATARSYKDGPTTIEARQEIALDYINTIPLSSHPAFGDVEGLGDGLTIWFGRDFEQVNHLLKKPEKDMTPEELAEAGKAFREAFYIALSIKKPSDYLLYTRGRQELSDRVDKLLPVLAKEGIISPALMESALKAKLEFSNVAEMRKKLAVPHNKTVISLRTELMNAVGVDCGLYCLDRLDATAKSTINKQASDDVFKFIDGLHDPEKAKEAGIIGYQLLKEEGLEDITYSVTLYEAGKDANYLRVQTDTYQGALNLNEGSKLQLGSTAKLRTLVSYLEAISFLHDKYSALPVDELAKLKEQKRDNLTNWAIEYLQEAHSAETPDLSLRAMLDASMERRYSANPGETFFTGGGIHRFHNFKSEENGRVPTVKESLQNSHNLPFVRIMRDVINNIMTHQMDIAADIYDNPDQPQRQKYLSMFIDSEGEKFLFDAWKAQKDKDLEGIFDTLVAKKADRPTKQSAALFRIIFPQASLEEMSRALLKISYAKQENALSPNHADYAKNLEDYIAQRMGEKDTLKDMQYMYDMYAPGKFNLNDLAYITKIHPLSIWLAQQKVQGQDLSWQEAYQKSTAKDASGQSVMSEVYSWLMKPHKIAAQNKRIRITIEEIAFTHLHKMWKKNGFAFDRMVPSLGSALGDSGDTPAALSEFVGIITNDGLRKPSLRFTELTLAPQTDQRTREYSRTPRAATQVIPKEVAQITLEAMQSVVSEGTARRIGMPTLSDGRPLIIGGKTGTGDNREKSFSRGGGLRTAEVKNRTATFVFEITEPVSGKKFFGTVLAYVDGAAAAKHKFTSALPSQIEKNLLKILQPYLDEVCALPEPKPEPIAPQKASPTTKSDQGLIPIFTLESSIPDTLWFTPAYKIKEPEAVRPPYAAGQNTGYSPSVLKP